MKSRMISMMNEMVDQWADGAAFGTAKIMFFIILLGCTVAVSSVASPAWIATSVRADRQQQHSFTLWYRIPAVSGSCVVKVWEEDWEGMAWDVNTMVLGHTGDWAMGSMSIYMDGMAVTATVEIKCYGDTAFIDDVALVWTYNKLPNPGFEIWSEGEPEGWGTSYRSDPQSIFKSRNAHSGKYCVGLVSTAVGVEDDVDERQCGSGSVLHQNSPNPFQHSTLISYSVPKATSVTLSIYDITGRLVERLVNETQAAGIHQVHWNRRNNPSGVYFYSLRAGEFVETRKMVVVE